MLARVRCRKFSPDGHHEHVLLALRTLSFLSLGRLSLPSRLFGAAAMWKKCFPPRGKKKKARAPVPSVDELDQDLDEWWKAGDTVVKGKPVQPVEEPRMPKRRKGCWWIRRI